MLRLKTEQRDFWDYLLPEEARRMHPELKAVDTILDDEGFMAPFRGRFSANRGRYTIPISPIAPVLLTLVLSPAIFSVGLARADRAVTAPRNRLI